MPSPTNAPAPLPALVASAEGELPEDIAKAIYFLTSVCMVAPGFNDATIANRNIRNGVEALTAAILARLTAAESAREAAVAERDEARAELHEALHGEEAEGVLQGLKIMVDARDAAEAALSAALARAERLEEALRDCVNQIEYEHGKFGGTGSGETVLHRTRALLAEET